MFADALLQQLPPAVDPNTMAASQAVGQQLSASEWLGPLAPIALTPFFGLATLSGIATYGPEWLQQRSALFQPNGALDSPLLFGSMAGLALFTSLPRLTKVSKPISLAAEKIEAYAAIIILIVVRMFSSQFQNDAAVGNEQAGQMMLSAGIGSVSLNLLMSAFAAVNVFVINMMKLPVTISVQDGDYYRVTGRRGWSRFQWQLTGGPSSKYQNGWICQRLSLKGSDGNEYIFCIRKWVKGDSLYRASTELASPT